MSTLLEPLACISPRYEALSGILEPDCNLAIWERSPIPGLEPLLQALKNDIRFLAPVDQIGRRLAHEFDRQQILENPATEALVTDVANLADVFAHLLGLTSVEIRLEIITTNSCRKFHADYVHARLISTLAGSGTQWLDAADAQRVANGEEPRSIRQLKAGDVGIFKGKLATGAPAIHRSPPIAGTGETRLLLVLNPPEERITAAP